MHSVTMISRFKNRGINVVRIMVKRPSSSINNKIAELLPNREQLKMEMAMKSDLARSKFNDLFLFYERFTGLSEVRIAQQRVLDAQDQFLEVQEKRREVYKQLTEVQTKRKDIHDKLQITKPGEPRYLKLIMEDHEIIGDETKLTNAFTEVEKFERELFTSLATAVRISHERERLQADKTKYWSIIGSIIGTIIGIIGSSINNSHRIKEIKCMLEEISKLTVDSTESSKTRLKSIEYLLEKCYDASNRTVEIVTVGISQNVAKAWNSAKSQMPEKETAIAAVSGLPRASAEKALNGVSMVKETAKAAVSGLTRSNGEKSVNVLNESSVNESRTNGVKAVNAVNTLNPEFQNKGLLQYCWGGFLSVFLLICSCCIGR